jgi:dihydrofolate reductase
MKVILYMDITANGFIGDPNGKSDFTSEADEICFNATCQRIGTVISGRKTYEVLYPDCMPLKEGAHWVLTHDTSRASDNPTVKFTNKPPGELLGELEISGINEVCLIGGQQTISEFLQKGLIDEIYLDIEPRIFGQGMSLFTAAEFEVSLELLEVKNLSPQTVQLHYKVKK